MGVLVVVVGATCVEAVEMGYVRTLCGLWMRDEWVRVKSVRRFWACEGYGDGESW
jgi:hypothetical protein